MLSPIQQKSPKGKLLASKDFTNYRFVDSPVAGIADRFFAFLASDLPAATECRFAYATSFLGRPPGSLGDYLVDEELDRNIKDFFGRPPKVVLAQGPMKPYGLLSRPSDSSSDGASSRSNSISQPNQVDPYEAIFLPWTVHQNLKDAIAGGEEEDEARRYAAYFSFACLVHETAHWVAVSRHGYIPHKDRTENVTSLVVDRQLGQVVIHRRDDWGIIAKELLLGHAFCYISYADGTSEVVTQRILPVNPKLKPSLPSAVQTKIIDCEIPTMTDITRYGSPNVREPPKWRDGGFLVVTAVTPFSVCHHGDCTIMRT
ncbi:hypothetical protein BT69DRAFT_1278713 [Atractiella rhizophila]|nr:hypothetical protein BT69DRAFT_1278713 [Atractiella rhizophila]